MVDRSTPRSIPEDLNRKSRQIMAGPLYHKQLPIVIKTPNNDDRRTHVWLTMELDRYPGMERGRVLIIRLTDESDAYFLHTLRMTYDDFHLLKEREKFLIDFDAFPNHVMGFFDMCLQEEFKPNPKFIMHLHIYAQNRESRMDVVETNEFQHVTRLKLVLLSADDAEIKKYLAECLKTARSEIMRTESQAQNLEKDLRLRLQNNENLLTRKTEELDKLQSEWNSRSSAVHEKYAAEMTKEREIAANNLKELQNKLDEEKKSFELNSKRTVNKLEARNYEVESLNKDLMEKKSRLEGALQELKDRYGSLEEEAHKRNVELQNCKRQLNEAQNRLRDGENMRDTVDDLIKKHQDTVTRMQVRIDAADDQNVKQNRSLEQKDAQIGRLQKDLQLQTSELNKANEIIRKMQLDNRATNEKLKIRSSIVVQQESVLQETKVLLEAAKTESEELRQSIKQRDSDIAEIKVSLEKEKDALAEADKSLENNANVISWLNRQLNVVNGRSVQALHPSSTLAGMNPGYADLNIPAKQWSGPPSAQTVRPSSSVPNGVSAVKTTFASSETSPEQSTNPARRARSSSTDVSEPVVDAKYLSSPMSNLRQQSHPGKPPLIPTSALKSVSSAYFG